MAQAETTELVYRLEAGVVKASKPDEITSGTLLEPMEPDVLPNESELLSLLGNGPSALIQDEDMRKEVVRELRTAQAELRAIFISYAVDREPAPGFSGPADGVANKGIPLPAWHQLCADTGVDGLKGVESAFHAAAPPEDPSPCLAEIQFFFALVHLAAMLADDGVLERSLYTLLYECVLPFARRESSATFSKVLGSRSYLLPYLEEIRGSFSGFGTHAMRRECRFYSLSPTHTHRKLTLSFSLSSFCSLSLSRFLRAQV